MELSWAGAVALCSLVGSIFGAGVTYGVMKSKLAIDGLRLAKIEGDLNGKNGNTPPTFVRRTECLERHETIDEKLACLDRKMEAQRKFAFWYLTVEKRMSPVEANQILNGN